MPSVITALALRRQGGAVVALRSGIHTFDFETGALQVISPLESSSRIVFNDGKVDRRGRFIIGASTSNFTNPTRDGGLLTLGADHRLESLDEGIHFSNGPCWSPDDRVLYFADSYRYEIYAYDYDIDTGKVANRRVFVDTRELGGMPDGATVDCDGRLWSAIYGGGKVVAFTPDGRLERVVRMPVRFTSSVMFGGRDLSDLYVTTIEHNEAGSPVEEGAGAVYVIEGTGARGVPEPRYAG